MIANAVIALAILGFGGVANAQTFQRLGGCPQLGCIFPPDQAEFLAGARFDIRLEVHAPHNGTEAFNDGVPDDNFSLKISNDNGYEKDVTEFFQIEESPLEHWNFTYYEDLFARDAKTPVVVSVSSKAYRTLSLYDPGTYTVTLSYYNTQSTVARWTVRKPEKKAKAKNIVFFLADGCPTTAITAARLIGHKQINGKFQTQLALDSLALSMQRTSSMSSFLTDSANSATSLFSGHKTVVNALNVYPDSSKSAYDDPKFETIAEMFKRETGGQVGIVSTAYIADATPMALIGHSKDRNTYPPLIEQSLHGLAQNYSDFNPEWDGPDVMFGGGAEQFIPGPGSPNGSNYYEAFENAGYAVVYDKTHLEKADLKSRTLGIFSRGNLPVWLDREVYPDNLKNKKNHPNPGNAGQDALDQPGLNLMTQTAIDILHTRSKADGDKGFFLLSEAASVDKSFHVLDYDRALGEVLELDYTVARTIEHLEKIGELEDTLIIVTADHAHGFDVYGATDTHYLKAQKDDRKKRDAIGVYVESGLPEYTVAKGSLPNNQTEVVGPQGAGFPVQWDVRYGIAAGFAAHPDVRETWSTHTNGTRLPAVKSADGDYVANPSDNVDGILINGTLPTSEAQGVHSLSDVPVYTKGPGSEYFFGTYDNTDIFFKMAKALGLGSEKRPQSHNGEKSHKG